jgi:hypothetical protein
MRPSRFDTAQLSLVRNPFDDPDFLFEFGGPVGERFGPTLAAEHLASEDGLQLDAETLRRWILPERLWNRELTFPGTIIRNRFCLPSSWAERLL